MEVRPDSCIRQTLLEYVTVDKLCCSVTARVLYSISGGEVICLYMYIYLFICLNVAAEERDAYKLKECISNV